MKINSDSKKKKKKKDGHKFFNNFNINCKNIEKKYKNIKIYIF